MNKEECLKALETLQDKYLNFDVVDELICLKSLIEEHFDNQPLKFEELKESEVYWHVYYGWIMIKSIHDDECIVITTLGIDGYTTIEFEENSFYRKQVE